MLIAESKLTNMTASYYLARELDKEIFDSLTHLGTCWPTLQDIQYRLVKLIGDVVPGRDGRSLLDETLTEMTQIWSQFSDSEGHQAAFRRIFIMLFDRIGDLFLYRVMIDDTVKHSFICWDPVSEAFTDFLTLYKPQKIYLARIEHQESVECQQARRQASLMLLPRLFGQAELKIAGVKPYACESVNDIHLFALVQNPEQLILGKRGV